MIVAIEKAERIPGLYDVMLGDGRWINDLTTRQLYSLVGREGITPEANVAAQLDDDLRRDVARLKEDLPSLLAAAAAQPHLRELFPFNRDGL